MPLRGIKLKLTTAIISAVAGTAAVLTVASWFLISYTFRQSLKTRAVETSKIITEALDNRQRQLAIRAEVITDDADFQTAYAFRETEPERLKARLEEMLPKLKASVGCVADLNGQKVSATGDGAVAKSEALAEAKKSAATASTIERVGADMLLLSAVPIKRYEQTLGYLVIGAPLNAAMLDQLKRSADADLFIVSGGEVRSSTTKLAGGSADLKGLEERLAAGQAFASVEGLSTEDHQPLVAWSIPLRAGNKVQSALVFALSAKDVNELQRRVLRSSVGVGLGFLFLAGLIGLVIASRISDPIVEIEHSFREIAASGDLSRRIQRAYPDEVGQMAQSFNLMQDQLERMHAQLAEAEQRMRGELKMASAVQEMLFPTAVHDGPRCEIAPFSQTSSETGGDWYTIIHSPDGYHTTAIITDVTGHGAAAALVTAILHGFFKATSDEIASLKPDQWRQTIEAVLLRLNRVVIESTRHSLVTSLLLLTFDHRTCKASYVNAGHLAPIVIDTTTGQSRSRILPMPASSIIGDVENPVFSWGEIQLQPNQLFMLYTDGLVECTNPYGEQYGPKRLRKVLDELSRFDARSVRDAALNDAFAFFGDHPREDDITLIIGRVR